MILSPQRAVYSRLLIFLQMLYLRGHNVDEILLDLSESFDIVPQRRLIHKIGGYGASNEQHPG